MPVEITSLVERDIPGAVQCIQQAFEHDPYNNWVFDKQIFSHERNGVSLSLRCKWGMQHALFHVAKDPSTADPDKVLGVACWLPPHKANVKQTWFEWYGDWLLWFQQGLMNLRYGRGGLNVKRYYIWKDTQTEAQSQIWDDPGGYYFCNIVTVLPETQGKKIGRLLFKHVTDRADKEGRKCYLESSRAEPNMAIYQKMGFELAREITCNDDGTAIKLYCMVREPQHASV
ncbi:hypothetical protein K431DRAFT_287219 [Polychaeton citri CBS 116435]|uniref:N-acetyltransferase domain-containing protein n=1 Tax=Polychaeton citri CBS 116435 TaxID=1314669 RepID=A0A9P4Q681_9PEZI|nr:hypothetical protein K431DRAFT_287219 [Polychaeton citri CBS 116435]